MWPWHLARLPLRVGAVGKKKAPSLANGPKFLCQMCQKFIRLSDSHLDVCARPGKRGLMKLTFGQLKIDRCQLISQDQNWLKSCSLCPTGENEVTWSSMLLAHSFVTLVFCVTVKKKKMIALWQGWFSGRPWSVWCVSAWVRRWKKQGNVRRN